MQHTVDANTKIIHREYQTSLAFALALPFAFTLPLPLAPPPIWYAIIWAFIISRYWSCFSSGPTWLVSMIVYSYHIRFARASKGSQLLQLSPCAPLINALTTNHLHSFCCFFSNSNSFLFAIISSTAVLNTRASPPFFCLSFSPLLHSNAYFINLRLRHII